MPRCSDKILNYIGLKYIIIKLEKERMILIIKESFLALFFEILGRPVSCLIAISFKNCL